MKQQHTLEDVVAALNTLPNETNNGRELVRLRQSLKVENAKRSLEILGVTDDDLDKLSVIHVSGTKGKGSTCLMVESILRNLKVKTGFLSSPHLLKVTERIRINGESMSDALFSSYFWKIFNILHAAKEDHMMPANKNFFTLMAYYVFLEENVDVAIIEVGCGGEFDYTNVIRNTKTVGITALGLDHTSLLGNTYEAIAWHKCGIIKHASNVFSTTQRNEFIPTILNRVREKDANLQFVPDFSEYKCDDEQMLAEIARNPTKRLNASLAIQLCYDWIRRNEHKMPDKSISEQLKIDQSGLTLHKKIIESIAQCYWPGRCEKITYRNMQIYVDGAHTLESIHLCMDWFNSVTHSDSNKKFLLFNVTRNREVSGFLEILHKNDVFEEALFTTNTASLTSSPTQILKNKYQETDVYKQYPQIWSSFKSTNKSQAFDCILDAFTYLEQYERNKTITLLVTGSLMLVAEVLKIIRDPSHQNHIS